MQRSLCIKKTIFDINNSERKKYILSPKEKQIMEIVSEVLNLYKKITLLLLEREIKMDSAISPIIQFCTKNCTKIIDAIYNQKESLAQMLLYVQNITYFIDELPTKKIENIQYLTNIIFCFVKKIESMLLQNSK